MTAAMFALQKVLPGEQDRPLPHREITENAAQQAGAAPAMESVDGTSRDGLSLMAHFGFGATAGAGYAMVAGKSGLPPAAEGAFYGVAVWGGSYLGLMPASGLYRPATQDTGSRNLLMITAHVVWGAALGVIWHSLAGRKRETTA